MGGCGTIYCEEIRRSNPGSIVVLNTLVDKASVQPKFRRLYIFLVAVKSGFVRGCRKIVGVDGCHLKGEYDGQLLIAVGVDPNNAMYPMAWCVVENENKYTWTWFITLLKLDVNITQDNEHEWTFINDRQKASHVPLFHDEMEDTKKEDPEAYEWLAKIAPRHWSRSHIKDTVKCDMVSNNLCEAFNRAILEARDKPIIEMLEWIRCYLSKRMVFRREWIAKRSDELLPNCYTKLETLKDWSASSSTIWFGDLQF
ncbi:hypothetical protein Vadar_007857 [Vaccinium darrowii]|uniref:Uncharacterized protein n=1 Tax=Vaccinium darrowii TaxID=229202 RepID=A0ACB7X899_9ERIC|nr:hypothetical protein Vadar_007857 [Vaccinium darrowii]